MAFEEDFSAFFDATDGFAVAFLFTPKIGSPISGTCIYDDAYSAATGGEVSVASSQPQIIYETSKITPPPRYGEKITVSAKDYRIVGIQPDGTGVTTLMLEEDEDASC